MAHFGAADGAVFSFNPFGGSGSAWKDREDIVKFFLGGLGGWKKENIA